MNNIIPNGPEIPDPTQLDLFGIAPQETGPNDSAVSVESSKPDVMIRSPTEDDSFISENGKKFDMNESSASSLYRKSRELVLKAYQNKDLTSPGNQNTQTQ